MNNGRVTKAIILGALLALCTLTVINGLFERFADVDSYLIAQETLLDLAGSAPDKLDTLIATNEVTWDPTNGQEFERVLRNLKMSEKRRILLVGSSQLLVDTSSTSYGKRVDKVLGRIATVPVETYNLSMGGMTAPEKAIVVQEAFRVIPFDQLVVAVTLWDSLATDIRPSIRLDPTSFSLPSSRSMNRLTLLNPSTFNTLLADAAYPHLTNRFPALKRRSAISRWIVDVASGTAIKPTSSEKPDNQSAGGKPTQYRYGQRIRQETIRKNTLELLDSVARVTEGQKCKVTILLTPFRQDAARPAYYPMTFYDEYVAMLREACAKRGFSLLDETSLLGPQHFGPFTSGKRKGDIDVLHFDTSGHAVLAASLAAHLGID